VKWNWVVPHTVGHYVLEIGLHASILLGDGGGHRGSPIPPVGIYTRSMNGHYLGIHTKARMVTTSSNEHARLLNSAGNGFRK